MIAIFDVFMKGVILMEDANNQDEIDLRALVELEQFLNPSSRDLVFGKKSEEPESEEPESVQYFCRTFYRPCFFCWRLIRNVIFSPLRLLFYLWRLIRWFSFYIKVFVGILTYKELMGEIFIEVSFIWTGILSLISEKIKSLRWMNRLKNTKRHSNN